MMQFSSMSDITTSNSTENGSSVSGGIILVALGAALWGTDALFRRGLALDLPASTLVFLEHVILVAVTFPVLWRRRSQLTSLGRIDWLAAGVIGVGSSALATVMFTAAFQYGDPTTPLLLQKVQPLIAVGAASLLLGERLLPRFAGFLVAGLAGAYLVAFSDPANVSRHARHLRLTSSGVPCSSGSTGSMFPMMRHSMNGKENASAAGT